MQRNGEEFWRWCEAEIQKTADKKDPTNVLSGSWKTPFRMNAKFKIYTVDNNWIRNNLCFYFGHGGHGYVHEFIPLNEVWIANQHIGCECKNVKEGQVLSLPYMESTILHEITEFYLMEKGMPYYEAHEEALKAELEAGHLTDPYMEVENVKASLSIAGR